MSYGYCVKSGSERAICSVDDVDGLHINAILIVNRKTFSPLNAFTYYVSTITLLLLQIELVYIIFNHGLTICICIFIICIQYVYLVYIYY